MNGRHFVGRNSHIGKKERKNLGGGGGNNLEGRYRYRQVDRRALRPTGRRDCLWVVWERAVGRIKMNRAKGKERGKKKKKVAGTDCTRGRGGRVEAGAGEEQEQEQEQGQEQEQEQE